MAREGSHQADGILVPSAAGAGRQDEEFAAVAVDKVAVGILIGTNSRREDRVGVLRRTMMWDAFCTERRNNCCISAEREAAEDRQTEDGEVEPA